jgi:hypothetical protein
MALYAMEGCSQLTVKYRYHTVMIAKRTICLQHSSFEEIVYLLIFGIVAVWKTPQIFVDPRFYGEEGFTFYPYCLSHSPLECLSYVHLGYYQLLTNIFVFMASEVSILYAPAVTTFCALLLHMIVVYQLAIFGRSHDLSRIGIVMLATAWALLPQSFGVWMNATNAQWVIGVSTLLILATPTFVLKEHRKTLVGWAAVCGLSGVPGVLLTPLFFVRALGEKSRLLLLVTIVFALCAIFQFILIETHYSQRNYVHTPLLLTSPTLLQTIIAPLFSVNVATVIGTALKDSSHAWLVFFSLSIGSFIIFVIVLAMAWSSQKHFVTFLVAAAWIFVSVVQTFGMLGNPLDLLSGWFAGYFMLGHPRYFLFGSMCLCLMLALGTKAASSAMAVVALAMLSLVVLVGAVQAQFATWPDFFRIGPSWREQLEACRPHGTCHVATWPAGNSIDIAK